MPLSDMACKNVKPESRVQKLSDGGGLYLQVNPNGSKLWRMNYRFQSKQKTLAFGAYPKVGLGEARKRRAEAKELLEAGQDPARKGAAPSGETFQSICEEWLTAQEVTWTAAYASRVRSRMAADLYPEIGHLGVDAITPSQMLAALRKVEARGSLSIAKRLRQTAGQVFRYAISTERASVDPSRDLKDALKPAPKVRHMAALTERQLPEFFAKLEAYDGDETTKAAIEIIVHTFVRTSELTGAKWSEIDGDLWRIPAERMKKGREHIVPLTPRVQELFEVLRRHSKDEHVARLSQNTMIYAMYRMGYHSRATIHGFRRTASTALNESGLWSPDAIEMQLAHVPGGVRAVYNAALYLPERRRIMEWWSQLLSVRKLEPVSTTQ